MMNRRVLSDTSPCKGEGGAERRRVGVPPLREHRICGGTPSRPASRVDLPLAGGGKAKSAAVSMKFPLSPEDHGAGGVQRHAAAGDEADLGVLDLAGSAFAAHLAHAFDHVQPTLHVGFR